MRYVKNAIRCAIIAAVVVAAWFNYHPDSASIEGVTADEKFQSIAKIVSREYQGVVHITYVRRAREAVEFVVDFTPGNITTRDEYIAAQQKLISAIATVLRLSATQALPSEPSTRFVLVAIIGRLETGSREIVFADAQELKAMAADAPNSAWLARLQPLPE